MDPAGIPSGDDAKTDGDIVFYSRDGGKVTVSKERWRESLPEYFEEVSGKPDEIYKLIVLSLQDGLCAECLGPVKNLFEIDPDRERAANILGVVFLENGMLDDAEAVLKAYLDREGPSGVVMTNLAKVYEAKGEERKAYRTLWNALLADPNQDNALAWWYSIHSGEREKERLDDSLVRLAEIPGSWRPVAYLAVRSFEEGEVSNALLIMEKVLEMAKDEPDALKIVSGELAQRGYVREALNMVYPVYDEKSMAMRLVSTL